MKLTLRFRQGGRNGEDTDPPDNSNHTVDQKQEESPQPSDPAQPAIPESNKDENETEPDQDRSQLSSSVIIDVPSVQSSLELSTITGATIGLQFALTLIRALAWQE